MSAQGVTVEVGGRALPPEGMAQLQRTLVEDHVALPARFELRFRDPGATMTDRLGLRMAADVRISMARRGGPSVALVRGDVTALEVDHDERGTQVTVRGFDRSHRLARGSRTATYRDVTDADLARTLARRADLPLGHVEDTRIVHAVIHQVGMSDWEFLQSRARAIGYAVDVRDGRFAFAPPARAGTAPAAGDFHADDPLQLVLGRNLERVRASVSSAGQVSAVEVRGWDPARKEAVVARADAGTTSAATATGPAELAGAFASPVRAGVARRLGAQAEADVAARTLADELGADYAQAEGVALGSPELRAGTAVSLGRVGRQFEGRYVLTATRHVADSRGYRTELFATGRRDPSLAGMLGALGAPAARGPSIGPALVSDVGDPDGLGRVRLHVPWLADDFETDWVRVVQVLAGDDHGSAFLPEVGDEVLVAFQDGDTDRAFVLGALFSAADPPRLGGDLADGGRVARRGVLTPGGQRLLLIDTGDGKGIEIVASGDLVLTASGSVRLSAGDGVEIDGGRGSLDLGAQGGITADGSPGAVRVSGSTIQLG